MKPFSKPWSAYWSAAWRRKILRGAPKRELLPRCAWAAWLPHGLWRTPLSPMNFARHAWPWPSSSAAGTRQVGVPRGIRPGTIVFAHLHVRQEHELAHAKDCLHFCTSSVPRVGACLRTENAVHPRPSRPAHLAEFASRMEHRQQKRAHHLLESKDRLVH